MGLVVVNHCSCAAELWTAELLWLSSSFQKNQSSIFVAPQLVGVYRQWYGLIEDRESFIRVVSTAL